MVSTEKFHANVALLLFLTAAAPLQGQYGKPSGIPQPLPLKKFDNKVTSVAIERFSSSGELTNARVLDANELASLRDLYKLALETQKVRAEFIRALQSYHDLLSNGGSFPEKEQAYLSVGIRARELVKEIQKLDYKGARLAVHLNLHHKDINDEVVAYQTKGTF